MLFAEQAAWWLLRFQAVVEDVDSKRTAREVATGCDRLRRRRIEQRLGSQRTIRWQ